MRFVSFLSAQVDGTALTYSSIVLQLVKRLPIDFKGLKIRAVTADGVKEYSL